MLKSGLIACGFQNKKSPKEMGIYKKSMKLNNALLCNGYVPLFVWHD